MEQTGLDEKPSCSFSDRLEANVVAPVQRRPSAIGRLLALRYSVPPADERLKRSGRAGSKSISASTKRRALCACASHTLPTRIAAHHPFTPPRGWCVTYARTRVSQEGSAKQAGLTAEVVLLPRAVPLEEEECGGSGGVGPGAIGPATPRPVCEHARLRAARVLDGDLHRRHDGVTRPVRPRVQHIDQAAAPRHGAAASRGRGHQGDHSGDHALGHAGRQAARATQHARGGPSLPARRTTPP